MPDDVDDLLRRAMATLDRQAPADYFATLASRTLARLDDAAPEDFVAEEVVTEDAVIAERDEHSGLQDIRNLASETKARLARRTSQELAAREDQLATSSASWKAMALPAPARRAVGDASASGSLGAAGAAGASDAKTATGAGGATGALDDLARERAARATSGQGATAAPDLANATSAAAAPPAWPRAPGDALAARRRRLVAGVGIVVAAAAGAMIVVTTRRAGDARDAMRPSPPTGTVASPPSGRPPLVTPIDPTPTGSAAVAQGSATGSGIGSGSGSATPTLPAKGLGSDDRATPPPTKVKGLSKPTKGKPRPPSTSKLDDAKPELAVPQAPLVKSPQGKRAGKVGSDEPSFDELVQEAGIKPVEPATPKLTRQALSADDIKRGMTAIAGQAKACFTGTEGLASVKLTVAPSGKVSKVVITGPFAGTPTAGCVERVVKSASFPPWDGGPQSFGYSYLLSE